jgi:hypothetical protein
LHDAAPPGRPTETKTSFGSSRYPPENLPLQQVSPQALCRTRTDDPFLTMEDRRRHDRSPTLTIGHEIPANGGKVECTGVAVGIRPRWN